MWGFLGENPFGSLGVIQVLEIFMVMGKCVMTSSCCQVPILFLLLLNKNAFAGTYNQVLLNKSRTKLSGYVQVVKCCQAGWELSEGQDFGTSIQCVPSKGSGQVELNTLVILINLFVIRLCMVHSLFL